MNALKCGQAVYDIQVLWQASSGKQVQRPQASQALREGADIAAQPLTAAYRLRKKVDKGISSPQAVHSIASP